MSFDSSRFTFNPWNDFFGVVMQQGRVQIDADWNEWLAELSRRIQAGALDTFGRAVVPQTTPHGFEITLGTDPSGATEVLIGPGRMYIDGLLAENHGQPVPLSGGPLTSWTPGSPSSPSAPPAGLNWDTALAELVGQNPVPYPQQPYLPQATFPTTGGPYLVYLDVWQREVTFLEDPDLVEKAVGVDTTGRLQTIWQVKWLDASSTTGVSCSTPDSDIPEWQALLLPPAAQLSTGVVQSTQSGPCCLAPNTGYTGLENQLYRVEIHQPKGIEPQDKPTFKWSRDNASVATGVTTIAQGGTSLVVQSTGRDTVLRFNPNDWVEITDDFQELQGLPGSLRQINTVTDASSTITLYDAISTVDFPVDANGLTDPQRHTRIRRWDQKGKVYQSDLTTVWVDLDAAGATGDIPVPPPGTTLVLEDGVTVSFNLAGGGFPYKTGQFWNFAARSTDGTVEYLDFAPPRGIHHHYAHLSVVDLAAGTASNCRTPWPPDFSSDCCGCTITVKPADLSAATDLQAILDKLSGKPNRSTLCLAPGRYILTNPLYLGPNHARISIEACQPGTAFILADDNSTDNFTDGLIVLDRAPGITLSGLVLELPSTNFKRNHFAGLPLNALDPGVRAIAQNLSVSIGLRVVNVSGLTVENCIFDAILSAAVLRKKDTIGNQSYQFTAGIFASGLVSGLHVEGNTFRGNGDFSAGYLHAPAANFIDPSTFFKKNPGGFKRRQPAQNAQKLSAIHSALDFILHKVQEAVTPTQASPAAATESKPAAQTTPQAAEQPAAAPQTATAQAAVTQAAQPQDAARPKFNTGPGVNRPPAQVAVNSGGFDIFVSSSTHAEYGGTALPAQLRAAVISGNTFSGLSLAVLILATTESVDLLSNQLRACHGGFWLLTPGDAFLLTEEPQELGTFGLAFAMGYPLPKGDTNTLTTIAPAPDPVFIYEGAQSYTDSASDLWSPTSQAANVTVAGGSLSQPVPAPQIFGASPDSSDQALYQSERYGQSFTYTFSSLPAGYYTVTLKLAEIFWSAVGQRIFDVSINGTQVLNKLDLISDSGANVADDQVFIGIPSVGGNITITFTGDSSSPDTNAKSGAIEILPQWSAAFLSTFTSTIGTGATLDDLQHFYLEIAQLAQQAYASASVVTSRLRVENNEMQRLTSMGLLVIGDDQVQTGRHGSLMVLANRMNMSSPFNNLSGGFAKGGQSKDALSPEASVEYSPFSSIVVIYLVSRCVVANNMVINETQSFYRIAMILSAGQMNQPQSTVPPPEVNVMANIFQGRINVQPNRQQYLNNQNVVYPVNTWNFLNTIIP